jgi:Amt family ammonium transporter
LDVFAQASWSGATDGLLFGNPGQLGTQAVAVLTVVAFSGVGTIDVLKLVGVFTPLRVDAKDEGLGLDVAEHGEQAYTSGEGAMVFTAWLDENMSLELLGLGITHIDVRFVRG